MMKLLTIALVLGGCGKVSSNQTDGGHDSETSADAPTFGPITVAAKERNSTGNGGVANVAVLVVGPDGMLRGRGLTDVGGNATVDVKIGDSVTVVYPADANNQHAILTTTEVEPGDH